MLSPFRKLDTYAAVWATNRAADLAEGRVASVAKFTADTEREQRIEQAVCKTCWYFLRPRIGGASVTTWFCGVCGDEYSAASTATDRVCRRCAIEHRLCTQCGGDQDLRVRRRKWPTPVEAANPRSRYAQLELERRQAPGRPEGS